MTCRHSWVQLSNDHIWHFLVDNTISTPPGLPPLILSAEFSLLLHILDQWLVTAPPFFPPSQVGFQQPAELDHRRRAERQRRYGRRFHPRGEARESCTSSPVPRGPVKITVAPVFAPGLGRDNVPCDRRRRLRGL